LFRNSKTKNKQRKRRTYIQHEDRIEVTISI